MMKWLGCKMKKEDVYCIFLGHSNRINRLNTPSPSEAKPLRSSATEHKSCDLVLDQSESAIGHRSIDHVICNSKYNGSEIH